MTSCALSTFLVTPEIQLRFRCGVARASSKSTEYFLHRHFMNDDLLPDLLAAIEQQLNSPETPYVSKTLSRLMKLGVGESEAKIQIALTLGEEMDKILRTHRPFDEKSYQSALASLPMELDAAEKSEL